MSQIVLGCFWGEYRKNETSSSESDQTQFSLLSSEALGRVKLQDILLNPYNVKVNIVNEAVGRIKRLITKYNRILNHIRKFAELEQPFFVFRMLNHICHMTISSTNWYQNSIQTHHHHVTAGLRQVFYNSIFICNKQK